MIYKGRVYQDLAKMLRELGLEDKYYVISARIGKLKWSIEDAIEKPIQEKDKEPIVYKGKEYKSLPELVKSLGMQDKLGTINSRYRMYCWSIEDAIERPIKSRSKGRNE